MGTHKNFGSIVNEIRLKRRYTLREFCKKFGHDPGNWSKVERSLLYPPDDPKILEKWATQLEIKKGSSEWFEFMDLASITRGKIPFDILNNQQLMKKVPLFFRTIRCQKPTKAELDKLIEILKTT